MLILLPVPNTTYLNALQGCKFITSWAKRPQPQKFTCFQGRREGSAEVCSHRRPHRKQTSLHFCFTKRDMRAHRRPHRKQTSLQERGASSLICFTLIIYISNCFAAFKMKVLGGIPNKIILKQRIKTIYRNGAKVQIKLDKPGVKRISRRYSCIRAYL